MLSTTIAGSLPKPAWLAKPGVLWAPWTLSGPALAEGQRDAVLVALREQETAGIDIVTDGEQSRQHFVHGFLEAIEGVENAVDEVLPRLLAVAAALRPRISRGDRGRREIRG